jgi:RNA polymerase sigma factor FliA
MHRRSVPPRRQGGVPKTVRDQIILDHMPLVKAIAIRVHENLPVHVDLDDLVHAGVLGLFDAVEKYNPDKQVLFHSYAKHRIKGAMLDSLRQLDWASRDLRKRQKQLDAVTRDLSLKLGRAPTEAEVAECMGIGIERWRRMLMELRSAGLAGGTPNAEAYGEGGLEFTATPDLQPDRICAQNELRQTLVNVIQGLPERYQKVVFLYYSDDLTMKEIGEMLGVNESRVSQIHKLALRKMADALQSAGISSSSQLQ